MVTWRWQTHKYLMWKSRAFLYLRNLPIHIWGFLQAERRGEMLTPRHSYNFLSKQTCLKNASLLRVFRQWQVRWRCQIKTKTNRPYVSSTNEFLPCQHSPLGPRIYTRGLFCDKQKIKIVIKSSTRHVTVNDYVWRIRLHHVWHYSLSVQSVIHHTKKSHCVIVVERPISNPKQTNNYTTRRNDTNNSPDVMFALKL